MSKKEGSGSGEGGEQAAAKTTTAGKKASTSRKTSRKASKKATEPAAGEAEGSETVVDEAAVEATQEAAPIEPPVMEPEPASRPAPEPEPEPEPAPEEAREPEPAPAPPPPRAGPADSGEIIEIEGVRGILAAMGGWLWDPRRRPWTIAVGAALALIIGLQFGGEEVEPAGEPAAAEAAVPVGEQSLAEEARLQVAAGDPLGAARRLEPEVTRTDRKGGDAHLHAALAHAYAQAGWGADAVPHFEWTARKDPTALRDEDLRDLVRLLGLPGATPEGVQATLISAGRRSVPFLEAAWEDRDAPVLVRRRAGEVLQRLGEDISLVETYRRLLERGACPARKEAVARLAAATDDKAVDLLEQVAESGRCGAAEARRALGE